MTIRNPKRYFPDIMIAFPRLSQMPSQARLWLYMTDRPLTDEEADLLLHRVDAFMETWSSHGRQVLGAAEFAEHRVLGLAAVVREGDISGCGIDKSVHVLEGIGESVGFGIEGGLQIHYRARDGVIQSTTRSEFRRLVQEGMVDGETPVFDLSVTRVGDLRRLELPLRESWHARAFPLPGVGSVQ